MRRRYPSRNIPDECLLSSSKRSAELTRTGGFAQGMKSNDVLISAWEETLARAKDSPAIFNTRAEAVQTFQGVEQRARDFESKIDMFDAGRVVAIQIGNHE